MAEKKSNVKMGVLNEEKTSAHGEEVIEKALKSEKKMKVGEDAEPGFLISSNDHSDFVLYGDQTIRLSPRSREAVDDIRLLPTQLPTGVSVKKAKK